MKPLNRYFLFLLLWLPGQLAWSQCETKPNDPTAFFALDINGVVVESFCVGQPVHFVHARPTTGVLSYGVRPGVGSTFYNTTPICFPPNYLPYTYIPTLAEVGMVTVSELDAVISNPIYYFRVYRVYDTPPPAFTVAPCPTNQALVTITDAVYDTYTYTFQTPTGTTGSAPISRGPGVIPVPSGATSITLTGHYTTNGLCESRPSVQPLTLAAPVKPILTSLTLSGPLPSGTATLAVGNLPAGYLYTLQVDTGTGFRNVPGVTAAPGNTSLSVPGAVDGRYRIARTDYCGGSPDTSFPIGTLSLTGTSARNRNQLLLKDAGPAISYTVTRNGTPINTLTRTADGFEDADVFCGSTYTYVVTATQPGGGVAISNSFPIPTVSNLPPPQPRLVASFNLNNVVVLTPTLATPTLPVGSSLQYSRTAGSGVPANFGKPVASLRASRDSTDLTTLRASPPCYSVCLVDTCGNISPTSPATCPAILSASAADADGSTAALTWTAFTGPDPAVPAVYTLQRLAADGTVLSTLAVTGNTYTDLTPPTDRQVLRYRLQIGGAGLPAGTFSYSNLASVTRQLTLAIPTAFTPNGDGLNDVLEVKGRYLNNYTFVVVDRNGQEVFRGTQRSETWDGTIKGHAPVLGAYVWRFQQNNEDGKPFSATGAVTILK
ncbi:gliding motility-associated-like protein [Hymenobacter sp. UYAg731]